MCSGWEWSLKGFLTSGGMFGGPPMVKRNALHLQIVSNPVSWDMFALQGVLMRMYMEGYPVRIGALFVLAEEVDRLEKTKQGLAVDETPFDGMSLTSQFARYGRVCDGS
jgi:hypothetical protein